jgi:hypothetical protein
MKDLKHIKRFNEHQENLNISDVSHSKNITYFKIGDKVKTKYGIGRVLDFNPSSLEELGHYPITVSVDDSDDEDERINGLGFNHGEVFYCD